MTFKRIFFVVAILSTIFFLNFLDHQEIGFPIHVDSWQMTSIAASIMRQHAIPDIEPFSGMPREGPLGNPVFQAVFSSISGLGLMKVAMLLPGVMNVVLALVMYTLAKQLFSSPNAALAVMAFQPLVLSQITMLGPFFLVSLTFGMIFSILSFYFLMRGKWAFFVAGIFCVGLSHSSSLVFALAASGLYFAFNPRLWSKLLWLALAGGLAVLVFIGLNGADLLWTIVANYLMFSKSWPYFQYIGLLGPLFMVLLSLGLFLVIVYERRATSFLLPIFGIMAADMFLYWSWNGFFLVYRRLISYIFLLTPFFVGYSVYFLAKQLRRGAIIGFALLILVLVPFAIAQNLHSRTPYQVYVVEEEDALFTAFANKNPGAYLLTDHLEAYSMPYYNLRPISLSPSHGANTSYFRQVAGCYNLGDLDCIASFLNSTGFEYLYARANLNRSDFTPVVGVGDRVIYRFQKIYNKQESIT